MADTTLADRYALLVEMLGEELGFERGWMTAVAQRLGIHRSYVSRIHAGDRAGIGVQAIDRAIQRLSLDPQFFYGPETPTSIVRATAAAVPRHEEARAAEDQWASLGRSARRAGAIVVGEPEEGQSVLQDGFDDFLMVFVKGVLEMPVFKCAQQIRDHVEAGEPIGLLLATVFMCLISSEGEAHQLADGEGWVKSFPVGVLAKAIERAPATTDPSLLALARVTLARMELREQRRETPAR